MHTTDLTPRYDGRKSFYGKAKIITRHGSWSTGIDLESYTTIVARFEVPENRLSFYGNWSATTRRHQWEFCQQIAEEFLGGAEAFRRAYWRICEDEKIHSFPQFLRKIEWIDFKNNKYKLNHGKEFII